MTGFNSIILGTKGETKVARQTVVMLIKHHICLIHCCWPPSHYFNSNIGQASSFFLNNNLFTLYYVT
jgi:hypothetical protein